MSHDTGFYKKADGAKHIDLGGTSLLFKVRQWLKFEEELNPRFGDEVAHLAHGEKVRNLQLHLPSKSSHGLSPKENYLDDPRGF
jgi:hypothetical protein